MGRIPRPPFSPPVESRIDHCAQGGKRCAVPLVECQVPVRISDLIGEQLVGPFQFPADRFRVGIEQELVGIEAKPGVRIVGTVHAVAIELIRPRIGQVQMPGAIGALADADRVSCRRGRTGTARPIPSSRKTARNPRPCPSQVAPWERGALRTDALVRVGTQATSRARRAVSRARQAMSLARVCRGAARGGDCWFMEWTSSGRWIMVRRAPTGCRLAPQGRVGQAHRGDNCTAAGDRHPAELPCLAPGSQWLHSSGSSTCAVSCAITDSSSVRITRTLTAESASSEITSAFRALRGARAQSDAQEREIRTDTRPDIGRVLADAACKYQHIEATQRARERRDGFPRRITQNKSIASAARTSPASRFKRSRISALLSEIPLSPDS